MSSRTAAHEELRDRLEQAGLKYAMGGSSRDLMAALRSLLRFHREQEQVLLGPDDPTRVERPLPLDFAA